MLQLGLVTAFWLLQAAHAKTVMHMSCIACCAGCRTCALLSALVIDITTQHYDGCDKIGVQYSMSSKCQICGDHLANPFVHA